MTEVTFYIFPAVFVFCKVYILLFSGLLNMIIASVVRWVGGLIGKWSVVDWSVIGGFNKTRDEKPEKSYKGATEDKKEPLKK